MKSIVMQMRPPPGTQSYSKSFRGGRNDCSKPKHRKEARQSHSGLSLASTQNKLLPERPFVLEE